MGRSNTGQIILRRGWGQPGLRKTPLNNNRGGNNRRRGRGNNNMRPGGNGGQQVNRIDSRARGNAPQMLEKYRKLANDAHLNGDRVNAEYYLQFADHYFRVIADTRLRQEEQRLRRDDRWQDGDSGSESDDGGDFGNEGEYAAFDQPPVYTRRDREERNGEANSERSQGQYGRSETSQNSGYPRQDAQDRPSADANGIAARPEPAPQAEAEAAVNPYEPPENPFLRENRGARGLRPRREDRRPRRDPVDDGTIGDPAIAAETGALGETPETDRDLRVMASGIDPDSLPPAFTARREEPAEAEAAPAPRRRARRKPAADDAGEPAASAV